MVLWKTVEKMQLLSKGIIVSAPWRSLTGLYPRTRNWEETDRKFLVQVWNLIRAFLGGLRHTSQNSELHHLRLKSSGHFCVHVFSCFFSGLEDPTCFFFGIWSLVDVLCFLQFLWPRCGGLLRLLTEICFFKENHILTCLMSLNLLYLQVEGMQHLYKFILMECTSTS